MLLIWGHNLSFGKYPYFRLDCLYYILILRVVRLYFPNNYDIQEMGLMESTQLKPVT